MFKSFGNRLVFGMSLPTLDNQLARIYEPDAPAPSQRLKVLQEAAATGLHVYVAMAPTYPECGETDLRKTLAAIKELNPITVFHEPINIRAENVGRIENHAANLNPPVKLNTEVFATPESWRRYALDSLLLVQRLATEMGLLHCLHLWPDKALDSKVQFLELREHGRRNLGLTSHQQKLKRAEDESYYDEKYLPWLKKWWSRTSEWPGKKGLDTTRPD